MYNMHDKPWREVVGLPSSSTDPVARAVDKEIYGDDVGRLIKTNKLYFISKYINCCN